jgi:hypothetical protein
METIEHDQRGYDLGGYDQGRYDQVWTMQPKRRARSTPA